MLITSQCRVHIYGMKGYILNQEQEIIQRACLIMPLGGFHKRCYLMGYMINDDETMDDDKTRTRSDFWFYFYEGGIFREFCEAMVLFKSEQVFLSFFFFGFV